MVVVRRALPVWAHRRGKTYGYVMMGGKCSPTCPPDFQGSPSDDDNTVAYHGPVSSTENYYCSPSGWRTQRMNGVDVVSCASAFYGSKGYYAAGKKSPYPPRADLSVVGGNDSPDVKRFSLDNDVAAVSGATPANGKLIDPIRWYADSLIPDADYDLYVEVGIEGDFNAYWPPGKATPSRTPSGITLAKIHLASRASSTRSRFDSTRAVASPPSPNMPATATTRARAARSIRPT
jgi:hypothetical protein